jgi:Secretion system C-terminal sorting domain
MKKNLQVIIFALCITSIATAQSDEPCGATLLTVNTMPGCPSNLEGFINPPTFTNSTSASAGVTIPALSCNGFTTTSLDFWFRVAVPAGGALKINVSDGGAGSQVSNRWDMACYSSSSGTCSGSTFSLIAASTECFPSNYPDNELSGLTAGSTVYIRMWLEAGNAQTNVRAYKICVSDPQLVVPTCSLAKGPLNASILNQAPTLSWVTNPDATSYDVYFGSTSTPPLVTNTKNSSFEVTGLSPNTTNYWYVIPKTVAGSAAGCTANVQSFTTAPPITNDECTSAVTLIERNVVQGTTVYATEYRGPSICSAFGPSAYANDVWYKFTTNAVGGSISIDLTTFVENGVMMDGVVQLFAGTCANLISLDCSNEFVNEDFESIDLTNLSPNTTHYIRVYGWQKRASGAPLASIYQPFYIEIYGNAVLPVELMSFTGNIQDKSNRLEWQTASERNVQSFVVERSNATEKDFYAIGKLKAVGNSTATNTYQFDDISPLGVGYYRLRTVDLDGSERLSKVITLVRKNEKFTINRIFPSPTLGETTIEFSSNERGIVELMVWDILGRHVLQKKISVTEGSFFEKLDVSTFMTGIYFVRLKSGLKTTEGYFVKQ